MCNGLSPSGPNSISAGLSVVGIFLGLTLLVRLPDLLLGLFPTNLWFYWEGPLRVFSLDLFTLVSLLALIPRRYGARVAQSITVGSILVLLVYESYEAVIVSFFNRQPLLHADWSHVVGGLYFAMNAGSLWQHAVLLPVAVGGIGLLWWGLPPTIRRLHNLVRTPAVGRGLLLVNLVVWPLVLFAALTNRGIERQTYQEICLSTTECLVHNIQSSATLQTELAHRRQAPADSTYLGYSDLEWENPPSIYLVVLESYGSVLSTSPSGERFHELLGRRFDALRSSGWHAATARSEAPVSGGLSWLSVASILLGTPIGHQPTLEHLRTHFPRYPHLVHTLKQKGYRTGLLQPPVRPRPGLRVENPYGFDRTFYFGDLNYTGPEYGWGIVPDQYSLSVAHDEFVASGDPPFFLLFEAVTSHAPWDRPPPPLVESPRLLNQTSVPTTSVRASSGLSAGASQTQRGERAWLIDHLRYDWQVLEAYLRADTPPNSLVVIVGDHQPHFANGPTSATPLHVLSRDEHLIRHFENHGFTRGLHPSPDGATLHHAGLYSLLIRVLTIHDHAETGRAQTPVPPHRRDGVKRAALLPPRS